MREKLIITKLNGHDKDGKIGKVYFKVGDSVTTGDTLFTIESGKGSLKYNSEFTGKIEELNIEPGSVVTKDQVVGYIDGKKEAAKTTGYSFGLSKPAKKELHTEVLIIGGGPGGYVAAIRSAQLGKKVILIEEDRLGGTCLNYGCIPTKALSYSTKVLEHIQNANEYGFNVSDFSIDMNQLMTRKNSVVDTLVGGVEHLMSVNDIEVIKGTATVQSEDKIQVTTKKIDATITYDKMIIAVGSEPGFIKIEGHDLPGVITSKDALELEEIPSSITIIGGGVIGMEFAFILNALGSEVHVVEFLPELLSILDQDVVDVIRESAEEKGIKVHTSARATSIKETINGSMLTEFMIGETSYQLSTEKVMMAVGRRARLDSLDLKTLKVNLNQNSSGIEVDTQMRTSNPNIYAIGDVTNILQLAHVASHQGMVASEHIAGNDVHMHYDKVPSAIFTMPEIGHVGITEKLAIENAMNYKVSKFSFAANGKSVAMGETDGFVKLISSTDTKTIIGGAIVGGHGTDMIALITNLIENKVDLEEATKVIYAHPTAAESIHEALLGLEDRGIHSA